MAGGKISPRQKMIGMMYLVLTALLALNVSKDILKAFIVVNDGLMNTEKTFNKEVDQLYARFDEKKTIDPLRVMENWKKAQQARKMAKELSAYVEGLKRQLIRETEGFDQKEEDTIQLTFVKMQDNYDVSTHILIGDSEDGSKGEARILKEKLINFRKDMLNLLPEADRKQINLTIDTEDPKNGDEDQKTWEMMNFYHSPLVAVVTILSKIQTDIKTAESDVVDALLKNVDADVIPFDTVAARVVAQSNYVLMGEEYKADIFLAAFNKTLKPQVLVGDYDMAGSKFIGPYDSLMIDHGVGRYNVPAQSEGIKKYSGVINMKTPKGKTLQFPFQSEYIVARPALTVSADKMNVMYAGLDNPISVSVPGVANQNLTVTIDNGSLKNLGNGKFEVVNSRIGKTYVNVSAKLENGETRSMGRMEFRVKPLPKPTAKIGSLVTDGKMKANELGAQLGIQAYYENFDFKATPKITGFDITAFENRNVVYNPPHVTGNSFNADVQNKLRALRRGTKVLFDNLTAVGPDGLPVKLSSIMITIQ
ncbi:MAG: gliding motility-associated protein GldM [Bacteroidetes bacterium]|nr:MAG: gliding motility-associated protein GldM [Bacteroidota bacterium]